MVVVSGWPLEITSITLIPATLASGQRAPARNFMLLALLKLMAQLFLQKELFVMMVVVGLEPMGIQVGITALTAVVGI